MRARELLGVVLAAAVWPASAGAVTFSADSGTLGPIPDGTSPVCDSPGWGPPRDVSFTVHARPGTLADDIRVGFTLSPAHPFAGDLRVSLTAPNGRRKQLFERTGRTFAGGGCGSRADVAGPYEFFDSSAFSWWSAAASASASDSTIPARGYYPSGADNSIVYFDDDTDFGLARSPASGVWTLRFEDAIEGDSAAVASASLTLPLVLPPGNDAFASAEDLSGMEAAAAGFNLNATKEAEEPDHAGSTGGHSVWYRWTAPASGPVALDTCNATFDTLLAVYRGSSVGGLAPVAANDDSETVCGAGSTRSALGFDALAGETYVVAVDADGGPGGEFTLDLKQTLVNDDFAGAELISGHYRVVQSSTGTATKQIGEPNHAGNAGGHSVWYRWVAPASGPVRLDTCGSDFDTLLAVYTGASVAGLTSVAANDDAPEFCGEEHALQSALSFPAQAGVPYRIAIDGYAGGHGASALALRLRPDTMIDSGPSGATPNASASFSFSSDDSEAIFECRLEPGDFAPCTAPASYSDLPEGPHTFEVRAVNGPDNADLSPASRTFTVDTIPPSLEITGRPPAVSPSRTALFSFAAAGHTSISCRLDDAAFEPCVSPVQYTDLEGGAHRVVVRASDEAGNLTTRVANWRVDRSPPATSIRSGPRRKTTDRTPTFSFSSNELGSTFECKLDGGRFKRCRSPLTTGRLRLGRHSFFVRAIDLAGNRDSTPAARRFTIRRAGR